MRNNTKRSWDDYEERMQWLKEIEDEINQSKRDSSKRLASLGDNRN